MNWYFESSCKVSVMGVSNGAPNNGINADWGIPRGFAALHTPAGYAGR